MTKNELVKEISCRTGIEKATVLHTVETLMEVVKDTMTSGKNVYLRGFGTFLLKKRKEKFGRVISRGEQIRIPSHYKPMFKPCKPFADEVKNKVTA
jgi:DNA-binding protein HU-beta